VASPNDDLHPLIGCVALPNQDATSHGHAAVAPALTEYQHTTSILDDWQRRLHAPLEGFERDRNEREVEGA
jgi:hypothetical protein